VEHGPEGINAADDPEGVQELFNSIDEDGSGALDRHEVRTRLARALPNIES
jgi:Ca2+-binding EF-hand superfamily protein